MGVASLILGIISLVTGWIPFICFIMLILAVVGLILGIVDTVKKTKAQDPKRGVSIAGLVICAVSIPIIVVSSFFSIIIFGVAQDEILDNYDGYYNWDYDWDDDYYNWNTNSYKYDYNTINYKKI